MDHESMTNHVPGLCMGTLGISCLCLSRLFVASLRCTQECSHSPHPSSRVATGCPPTLHYHAHSHVGTARQGLALKLKQLLTSMHVKLMNALRLLQFTSAELGHAAWAGQPGQLEARHVSNKVCREV